MTLNVQRADGSIERGVELREWQRRALKKAIESFNAGDRPLVQQCEACGYVRVRVPPKGVIPRLCLECRKLMGQMECAGPGSGHCPAHARPPHRAILTYYICRREGKPWRCTGCAMSAVPEDARKRWGEHRIAQTREQTHCLRGHELAGDNLRLSRNARGAIFRRCRICCRDRARNRRKRTA